MEKELNAYLGKLEKYLKPVAVSERIDIINEIKSEMQELQGNGMSAEEIIERRSQETGEGISGRYPGKKERIQPEQISDSMRFFQCGGILGNDRDPYACRYSSGVCRMRSNLSGYWRSEIPRPYFRSGTALYGKRGNIYGRFSSY